MRLIRYVIRRILLLVPVLLAATFIAFALTRILPGNPIDRVLPPYISAERRAEIKHQARLDLPFYTQFYLYLLDLAHGDMGVSYTTAQNVSADLAQRYPATFNLVRAAIILANGAGDAMAAVRSAWACLNESYFSSTLSKTHYCRSSPSRLPCTAMRSAARCWLNTSSPGQAWGCMPLTLFWPAITQRSRGLSSW